MNLLSISVACLMLGFGSQAKAYETVAVISGVATVADGDGVKFGKVEVRLQGIAAPEDNSRKVEIGGPASTASLRELIEGKFVVCHLDGTTAGRRPVGVCFVDGVEVNLHQVAAGQARDCPAFSKGRYSDAEQAARAVGIDQSKLYELPGYCG